jgi:hypothetical protein
MDTKLTLKLDQSVIERAKKFASDKKISLSKLVENYLDSVTKEKVDDFEISPFIRSIASGTSVPLHVTDKEERDEHIDFLAEKYR